MMPGAKTILVVDDDEKIGGLICHFLEKYSFEVRRVSDGLNAIAFLRKRREHFDIMITDYSMPLMNGLELTKIVRRWYPRTVIFGMSGFEGVDKDFMKAGALAFFRKPFHLPDMLSTINTVFPLQ